MFGSAFTVRFCVPVNDVVHGGAIAEEDAVKAVGVGGCVSLFGLFGYNGGAECE